MNPYIARLKKYLADKTPDYGYTDARSLLEMLYYYYSHDNPTDNGVIRCQLHEVGRYLAKLPVEDGDKVFDVITDLINAYEKEAFLQGLQTGARLSMELEEN